MLASFDIDGTLLLTPDFVAVHAILDGLVRSSRNARASGYQVVRLSSRARSIQGGPKSRPRRDDQPWRRIRSMS
jgi:hypothetical protein